MNINCQLTWHEFVIYPCFLLLQFAVCLIYSSPIWQNRSQKTPKKYQGPFYYLGITFQVWMRNDMPRKCEVWSLKVVNGQVISSHFLIDAITYPCWALHDCATSHDMEGLSALGPLREKYTRHRRGGGGGGRGDGISKRASNDINC